MSSVRKAVKHIEPHSEINGKKYYLVKAASARMLRFMPYLEKEFPATASRKGIIESELAQCRLPETDMPETNRAEEKLPLVKKDSSLPVTGHVEDRGGIYAVLKIAEDLAVKAGMILPSESRIKFADREFRDFFSQYLICVKPDAGLSKESQERLYNSIDTIAKSLGFEVGCECGEENCIEIGESMIEDMFMGYAAAALRLKVQLSKLGRTVDEEHPLLVYLPCENEIAAGGIAFGLKQVFGDLVQCFFVGEEKCLIPYVEQAVSGIISGWTEGVKPLPDTGAEQIYWEM